MVMSMIRKLVAATAVLSLHAMAQTNVTTTGGTNTPTSSGNGGGGGAASMGSVYQMQVADGAGKFLGSNITVDSTGNNLTVPGLITAKTFNGMYDPATAATNGNNGAAIIFAQPNRAAFNMPSYTGSEVNSNSSFRGLLGFGNIVGNNPGWSNNSYLFDFNPQYGVPGVYMVDPAMASYGVAPSMIYQTLHRSNTAPINATGQSFPGISILSQTFSGGLNDSGNWTNDDPFSIRVLKHEKGIGAAFYVGATIEGSGDFQGRAEDLYLGGDMAIANDEAVESDRILEQEDAKLTGTVATVVSPTVIKLNETANHGHVGEGNIAIKANGATTYQVVGVNNPNVAATYNEFGTLVLSSNTPATPATGIGRGGGELAGVPLQTGNKTTNVAMNLGFGVGPSSTGVPTSVAGNYACLISPDQKPEWIKITQAQAYNANNDNLQHFYANVRLHRQAGFYYVIFGGSNLCGSVAFNADTNGSSINSIRVGGMLDSTHLIYSSNHAGAWISPQTHSFNITATGIASGKNLVTAFPSAEITTPVNPTLLTMDGTLQLEDNPSVFAVNDSLVVTHGILAGITRLVSIAGSNFGDLEGDEWIVNGEFPVAFSPMSVRAGYGCSHYLTCNNGGFANSGDAIIHNYSGYFDSYIKGDQIPGGYAFDFSNWGTDTTYDRTKKQLIGITTIGGFNNSYMTSQWDYTNGERVETFSDPQTPATPSSITVYSSVGVSTSAALQGVTLDFGDPKTTPSYNARLQYLGLGNVYGAVDKGSTAAHNYPTGLRWDAQDFGSPQYVPNSTTPLGGFYFSKAFGDVETIGIHASASDAKGFSFDYTDNTTNPATHHLAGANLYAGGMYATDSTNAVVGDRQACLDSTTGHVTPCVGTPGAVSLMVASATAQALASTTYTALTATAVNVDSAGGWANNAYTIPTTGTYEVVTALQLNDNTTNVAYGAGVYINSNGDTNFQWSFTPSTSVTSASGALKNGLTVVRLLHLTKGTTIHPYAYNDSSASVNTKNMNFSVVLLNNN